MHTLSELWEETRHTALLQSGVHSHRSSAEEQMVAASPMPSIIQIAQLSLNITIYQTRCCQPLQLYIIGQAMEC